MNLLREIGTIMSAVGIPSIFGFLIYVHKKHISIMNERIALLESEKQRLEANNTDRLLVLLESKKREFEILLEDKEQLIQTQSDKYEEKISQLEFAFNSLEEFINRKW